MLKTDEFDESKTQSKIAIIGGGLVGSLAALLFAKKGYNVQVYEYREDIRNTQLSVGRSINLALSQRGRRALREVGLEKTVLEMAIPMRGRMLHDVYGKRTVVLYDPCNKECLYSVGRKYLNELLIDAGEKFSNITYNFNTKLLSSDLNKGSMEFKQQSSGSEKTLTTSADLLVGCDGAFSAMRQQMLRNRGFNFSQEYIEHGYLELCIPAKNNEFQMPENYLHIWPRDVFMMIALPNQDRSFTVTLFMPFNIFESIKNEKQLISFFNKNFADAVPLIGEEELIKQFFQSKPQHLVSIKCNPYHTGSKVVLLGDAAHAMVPFYGQGMNAGLEDCRILMSILESTGGNFEECLDQFSKQRWRDAHAMCDLAMYNYLEMRDLTKSFSFRMRKYLDTQLFRFFPTKWVPLYNSVSFSDIPYSKCRKNRQWQDKVLQNTFIFVTFVSLFIGIYLFIQIQK